MDLDTIVSKEVFVRSFGCTAIGRYNAYTQLLAHKGEITHREFARISGIPETTAWQWIQGIKENNGSAKPQAFECAELLENLGLLPLRYNSPKMRDFNILASWVFWSGSISKSGGYVKKVIVSPDGYADEIRSTITNLGLESDYENNGRNAIKLTTHGACIGRLLLCMGLPEGRKSFNNVNIPQYVTRSQEYSVVRDFVDVLLKAKKAYNGEKSKTIRLFATRSKDAASRLGFTTAYLVGKAGYAKPKFTIRNNDSGNFRTVLYVARS